jgi:hypothetical protein
MNNGDADSHKKNGDADADADSLIYTRALQLTRHVSHV